MTETSEQPEQRPFDTPVARLVLEDCEHALARLRQEPHGPNWRILWCSIVTLLRTVGDVLARDARSPEVAPEMRAAQADWWNRINDCAPEPAIFWQFIRHDRNALVHEYRFTAEQGIVLRGSVNSAAVNSMPINGSFAEATYQMTSGPFAGRDQRDVVQDAITWWHEQLDEIAVRAAAQVLTQRWSRGDLPPPENA